MRRVLSGRRDPIAAGLVTFCLVAVLVVAAVGHDGFRATQVNLNDGGVWVTSRAHQRLGRLNTQIFSIEVALDAGESDVAQLDDTVVLVDDAAAQFLPVDVRRAEAGDPRPLPKGGTLQLGGDVATVTDPSSGRIWLSERSAVGSIDVKEGEPTADMDEGVVTATGVDGVVHAYVPGAAEVVQLGVGGDRSEVAVDEGIDTPQLTAVGSRVVLLDGDAGRVVVPGREPVELDRWGGEGRLQQAGPANGSVVVATADALLSIPLEGGEPRVLDDGGTGSPSAPVWLDGCAYGAWAQAPRYAQICNDRDPQIAGLEWANSDLVFRVNRDRVVLNDTANGVNLVFTEDEPEEVSNWDDADDDTEQEEDEQPSLLEQQACDPETTQKPKVNPDEVATRPGRPVIVPVLDNDEANQCDILRITVDGELDPSAGTVQVVEDGSALQVTPAVDRTEVIQLRYTAVGAADEPVSGDVRVSIAPEGTNSPPEPEADRTLVEAGRSVVHNVLVNDADPDGDSLTLVDVKGEGGTIEFQANGEIRFTAAGGNSLGERTLTYTVRDEHGGEGASELTVKVMPQGGNIAPTARRDRLVAFVGEPITIDLLANDTDPNDDDLRLVGVEADSVLQPEFDDSGELHVTPSEDALDKSFTFAYQISDGEDDVEGYARIDVRSGDGNTPPVPVRDDVVVRPGTPSLVDLVVNDIDLDGDLLAVTTVEVDPSSGVSVEVLEGRIARVNGASGFTESTEVRYSVSDGVTEVPTGVIVVRPHLQAGVDQPPITRRDEVRVRAGNATAIPVVRNDIDPEGEILTVESVAALGEGQGSIFVEGDELRYQAPRNASGSYSTFYEVADPTGNIASGQVEISVTPADAENHPPNSPLIEGRARSGSEVTIKVPLVGLDPDGDTVGIMGVVDPPRKGEVTRLADGFTYAADPGAFGADEFTFLVQDSGGLQTQGVARVVIVQPTKNSPPVAVIDDVVLSPGEERVIDVLANDTDADGDALSLLEGDVEGLLGGSGAESVRIEDDRVVYEAPGSVPEGGLTDSFTYGVTDGRGGSARGVVSIVISDEEREPVAPNARDDVAAPHLRGSRAVIDVLANDDDPDAPDAVLDVTVLNHDEASVDDQGRVVVDLGDVSIAFIYQVTDADGEQGYALVQIPVVDALPPVANPDEAQVEPGDSVKVDVLANDEPSGEVELVRVLSDSDRGGTTRIDGSQVVFTADASTVGRGGFAYQVAHGDLVSVGFARITITGNVPPTIEGTSVELPAGGERRIALQSLVLDADQADGHEFSVSGARGGISAEQSDGTLVIAATRQARGETVDLTVTVTDAGDETDIATIDVTVTKFDQPPPVAVDDVARTTEDRPVTVPVTQNDVNPAGGELTVGIAAQQGGTATADGGSITFTPERGFFGVALVTYSIQDDTGEADRTSQATVRITVIGIPDKPPAPAGEPESHEVRLTWGVPANNGAPITGYVIRTDQGQQQEARSNSHVFTGLRNGTPYRFQVAARNEAVTRDDQLDFSDWSSAVVPDQVPDQPAPPTVEHADGALLVRWAAPNVDGTPVTLYRVRISPRPADGGPTSQDLPASQRSVRWAGLRNGTRYTFTVMATNDAGDSPESPPSSVQYPSGIPFAPPSVTAERLDDAVAVGGAVRVRWSWDTTMPGSATGDPATGFHIRAVPEGGGTAPAIPTVAGNARETVVRGLTNGERYRFVVRAENRDGPGEEASSTVVVPARIPDPPASVSARPGNGSATLTITPPAGNVGLVVNHYTIAWTGGSSSTSSTSVPLSGLQNGTTYTFQVAACNDLGCSQGTTSSAPAVTPFGPPSVSVQRTGPNSARWTWGSPAQPGVEAYSVSPNFGGGTRSGNSYAVDVGNGAPRQICLTVTAAGQGVSQASGSVCHTTDDTAPRPPTLTISTGTRQDLPGGVAGSCSGSACHRVRVAVQNFPVGIYSVTCHGYRVGSITVGPGGSWSGDTFGSQYNQACWTGANQTTPLTLSGPISLSVASRSDGSGNHSATVQG